MTLGWGPARVGPPDPAQAALVLRTPRSPPDRAGTASQRTQPPASRISTSFEDVWHLAASMLAVLRIRASVRGDGRIVSGGRRGARPPWRSCIIEAFPNVQGRFQESELVPLPGVAQLPCEHDADDSSPRVV